MSWKKVLVGGQVTNIADLFTVASGDMPASGEVKAIILDSTGALSVGEAGGAGELAIKNNNTAVSNAATLDFGNKINATVTGTEAEINVDMDATDLEIGTNTSGFHDFTTTDAVSSAINSIDSTLALLIPSAPPLLGTGHTTLIGSTFTTSANITKSNGTNYSNVLIKDPDTNEMVTFEVTGGTGNASARAGAFKIIEGDYVKISVYDVSAGAYIDYYTIDLSSLPTLPDVNTGIATTLTGGTLSWRTDDYYNYSNSDGAEGFFYSIDDLKMIVSQLSGSAGVEFGYLNNKFKVEVYDGDPTSGGSVKDTYETDERGIIENYILKNNITSIWHKRNGSAMTKSGGFESSIDGSGNSLYNNSYYIGSGITYHKPGDKVNIQCNTALFEWMKDASGNFYISNNNSAQILDVSYSGLGAQHNGYFDLSEYTPTFTEGTTTNKIGGSASDYSNITKRLSAGNYYEVSSGDTNEFYDTSNSTYDVSNMKDLNFKIKSCSQSKTVLNFFGQTGITNPKINISAGSTHTAESSARVKTYTGDYASGLNSGSAVGTYDNTADITSDTGYTDSLIYNGNQFSHPYAHDANLDFTDSAYIDKDWTNYVAHDYTGINTSIRYMMQEFSVNSSATSQLKLTIKNPEWTSDGQGNNNNLKIFLKLRDGSNNDLTNWFDACSNMGASPPSTTDPDGTACHNVGSADNDYSTDIVKICDLGMFLNDSGAAIQVLCRVGLDSSDDMVFESVLCQPNV